MRFWLFWTAKRSTIEIRLPTHQSLAWSLRSCGRDLVESITVNVWTQLDSVTEMVPQRCRRPEATLFCHFFNREGCGFQKVLRSPHPQHCYPAQWAHSSGLREAARERALTRVRLSSKLLDRHLCVQPRVRPLQ